VTNLYEGVISKVARAKKHIDDFRAAAIAFGKTDPYGIVIERDPKTRQRTYTITKVTPIPPEISAIAGDAIQNLRSALDYLAYGLVRANNTKPSPQVCFPISESEPLAEREQARFAGQVQGMRQDAIYAIKAIKPYKGGNDTLWRLHRLNIIDKHRLLMAAGTCVSRLNPGFHSGLRDYLLQGGVPPEPATILEDRFPLKAGDKFSVEVAESDVYHEPQLLLEIAFNEPTVAKAKVVLTVLKESRRCVQEIAGNLTRFMY
jgi:hypothetical protein